MGAATAQEAIAIGLNWILAPVVDVNNNPANPVINVRAFGDDAGLVGQLGAAFIQGAHHHPVLTSAKHFPGHGDTAMDSHLDLPTLPHSLERLRRVELPPFKAAIAAGVDSVMSAHLRFPALDAEYPATLSSSVLTGLLRTELGFDGLIVTDALIMGAIAYHYGKNEAAVMAIEAGADILLMPLDAERVVDAVETAVAEGRLSAERIQESVERIGWAKQRVGQNLMNTGSSHAWETLPPQPIDLSQLSTPAVRATAQAILQDSMMVSVDEPLPPVEKGLNIVLLDDRFDARGLGHHTGAIATPLSYGYDTLFIIDRHTPTHSHDTLSTSTNPIVLQVFVRGNPFRGTAGLSGTPQQWLDTLLGGDRLQGLVVYGSPYMLDYLKARIPDSLPVIFSFGQMPLAQKLAMQALFDPSHDARGIAHHSSRFT
jgi:beta-glucosidase